MPESRFQGEIQGRLSDPHTEERHDAWLTNRWLEVPEEQRRVEQDILRRINRVILFLRGCGYGADPQPVMAAREEATLQGQAMAPQDHLPSNTQAK